ncbi:MAG: D-alanine--D-alanine ligase [Deltaproteobacteria bacterium]|jgi:D-alanine-D-alanine ligase|nr:D-alanine--D-alanine ligase [Deltaproteobacteria bacterium]MBW2532907.1 D-alanine--D-alanine ligase [Deltaproteobacteria bacterium]
MTHGARRRVAVFFGGRSAEHEISILSARFIVQSLDRDRYEPVLVGIDKRGRWHLQDESKLMAGPADARQVAIDETGPLVSLRPYAEPTDEAPTALVRHDGALLPVDVAFPILHGPMGEDGCMQGLFELAQLPYVGSGVLGCAVGMDKDLQRRALRQAELPVVPSVTLNRRQWQRHVDGGADDGGEGSAASEDPVAECEELGFPLFVKPANMGSSLGVSRARDRSGLVAAIAHAFEFDTKVVVERGLDHPREIECAVLGNEDPRVSEPGEIAVTHADGFYSYDAKYLDPDGARLIIPAELHQQERTTVQLIALQAFRCLDGAGMARVDMFLTKDHEIYVNEVNTIPGFTAISMYPQLFAHSGVPAVELVSELVELGLERGNTRAQLRSDR